ncbi:cell wall metabolism sensor histidine kinase WalK [Nonomuraea sp. NEAU-A123]|uniref:sensor histidine kinase n=1 Tax=Nonomuraea sp. NEAU-A123 TaxID=2839649 RepID=UPI001BE483BA|nr:HAMP domain-containing sensor histidine kinase [Nonomuraea sp. NEAU-A123]MBT2235239.1 HAMP domain-containing histidine kinase [Nonomuraea sp. NEAU-A123]
MRPSRWTLRARLVMAILGLTTVALVLANVVGIALLSDNLLRRVDDQLNGMSTVAAKIPATADLLGGGQAMSMGQLLTKRVASVARIYIYSADGKLLTELPVNSETGPELLDIHTGDAYTVPGTTGPSWRMKAVTAGTHTVVFAQSLAEIEATRASLSAIAFAVSALVLLLLGLAADAVVRLGLRPLTRMERTAGQIAMGDFASRVPAPDPHTEPGRLGTAMNVMLDRVEYEIAARTDSESRMRRFLADASHELRTPLTSVRGFAELYRRGGGDEPELMRRIEEEADRMGVLVNDLLTLAQLDQERPMDHHPVDLLEVAADTIRDARVRVPGRQVKLSGLGGTLAPVSVMGDEARLRQVAANLVGNALVHTPQDASVTVSVGTSRGMAVFEVADTGPGVPRQHVPHVFDRLYRVGQGRSRTDGGAGLGLAIVAAIVRAHGGKIELDSAPGQGATFRVLLPGS